MLFSGDVQKTPCPLTIGADPLEKESKYIGYMDDVSGGRSCVLLFSLIYLFIYSFLVAVVVTLFSSLYLSRGREGSMYSLATPVRYISVGRTLFYYICMGLSIERFTATTVLV